MDKKEKLKKLKIAVYELDGTLNKMKQEEKKKYIQEVGYISIEEIKEQKVKK